MISYRRIPLWVAVAAVFAIAIIISASLVILNQTVDQAHQGEILLTTTRALSYKMESIEWELIAEQTVNAEMEQELAETRAEITQTLDDALALDPRNADLLSAKTSLAVYLKWLDEEVGLLKFGDVAGAKQIDNEHVDPSFDLLAESIIASQTFFIQRAGQIRTATNIGSITFIMLASLLITTLWFNNQQAWTKTLQATTEQEALMQTSKHEKELAVYAEALNRRNIQLQASANITRQTAEIQDSTELMNAVVNLTAEQFGYSHVGLYLLNEQKGIAFLQAASSQTGMDLIKQGYSVEIDKRHPFGSVAERGDPHFISNTADVNLVNDDHFPRTQSRIILPLTVRGAVIGILDLHSEQPQTVSREDEETLLSLANLIAISMDSVRLLNETRALVGQLETYASYQSKDAWQKFTSRNTPAYQYTPSGVRPVFPSSRLENGSGMKIPLTLRGNIIGAITLRRKNNATEWNERERLLVEKIAAQVTLALENSRLINEAQKNAQRDQLITNVSNRIRETLDTNTVIKIAAVELQSIFDLKEAEVSIGSLTPDAAPLSVPPGNSSRRANSNV